MNRFLGKHRPLLLGILSIVLLVLSFSMFLNGQDWLTFKDSELRSTITGQMHEFRILLEEYDNEAGYQKIENAQQFFESIGGKADLHELFEEAMVICADLESGGLSPLRLKVYFEAGKSIDTLFQDNIPLDSISGFISALGFEEAARYVGQFHNLLSKTGNALLAYEILRWVLIGLAVLSLLLMLFDRGIGPLLFVLADVLTAASILGLAAYVERKVSVSLTLAPAGILSVAFSAGSLILWLVLGGIGKRSRRQRGPADVVSSSKMGQEKTWEV